MNETLGQQAYRRLRNMIVCLDLAPGAVLQEHNLQDVIGVGRTPLREALQRLAREHFVQVIPRRGMFVAGIDVSELATLFETRSILEPYAARLAAAQGTIEHWDAMAEAIEEAEGPDLSAERLLVIDRRCHEIMWNAAGNRFLLDPLDTLYAQSDRLWHLHLSDVADMSEAVTEHVEMLDALRAGATERAGDLMRSHIHSFNAQIRDAVTTDLTSPLATTLTEGRSAREAT